MTDRSDITKNPFVVAEVMASVQAGDIMTRQEVAEYLRLKPSTVDDLARRGEIPSVRFGRSRRYKRSDIVAYVNSKKEPRDPR